MGREAEAIATATIFTSALKWCGLIILTWLTLSYADGWVLALIAKGAA